MEIPNQRRRITTRVPKGIARKMLSMVDFFVILPALECSPHKMRFMTKKMAKIVPVTKPEVRIVFASKIRKQNN